MKNRLEFLDIKNFCASKNQENEKSTYRTGQNICKWCKQQGIKIKNIQIAHTTQY